MAQPSEILNKTTDVHYNIYANKKLELCNSYIENKSHFRYGYKNAAFRKKSTPIDGRYEINCSTFSMLIALGISFKDSQYKGGGNYHIFKNNYTNDILKWFSDSIHIRFSRDIAQKLYMDGYSFLANKKYSNLESGDILFFNLDTSNDRSEIDFMGIDHSAIFGYRFGDKYIIYEVGDDKGPQEVLKSNKTMDKLVLVGRMPRDNMRVSRPKILGYNETAKIINYRGGKDMNYKLVVMPLDSTLKKGSRYTLFINAYLDKGIWLNATYNNTT